MSAISSGLFHLRTAYRAMQEIWRRPSLAAAAEAQEHCLRMRIEELARTSFGAEYGFSPGMEQDEFFRRVPSLTVSKLDYFLERIRGGEPDVLFEGSCGDLVGSQPDACGRSLLLPFPAAQRSHLRRAFTLALGLFNARNANSGVWRGRCLFLDRSDSPEAAPQPGAGSPYSFCTALQASLPGTIRAATSCRTPEERRDVSMILAAPESILADDAHWPRLACWLHAGGFLQPYAAELRRRLGTRPAWHELYGGAFGLIAAQDNNEAGLRLLCDTGVYLEFCRAEEAVDCRTTDVSARLLPLGRVEAGVDYALFVTTPSGLCRHPTGDVVRFLSCNPPRLILQGKIGEVLDSAKENLRARDCAIVLEAVASRQGWSVIHFHVTTQQQRSLVGQAQICHEWWIELQPGTAATPTGPVLSRLLDEELLRLHPRYAERRKSGALHPPLVRLLMPGIFGQWLQSSHLQRAQVPCCLGDRTIADALAGRARFYA